MKHLLVSLTLSFVFKVVLGHWVHLHFFRKYDFKEVSCPVAMLFSTKLFICVPRDSTHTQKIFCWNLEILNFKTKQKKN